MTPEDIDAELRSLTTETTSSLLGLDEAVPRTGYEVMVMDTWLPARPDMWRSWTGRRAVWGVEHHGPVFMLGTNTRYTGSRMCGCPTCQTEVEPASRMN